MKIRQVAKICSGQDGAIFGSLLFRFDHRGACGVYDLNECKGKTDVVELTPLAHFTLDRADVLAPHSNAVTFGMEYYAEDDEFPLLYSNLYNNRAKEEDPMRGVCCVYRLQRTENGFQTTLVQLIEIGFVDDPVLWRAYPDRDGVRPYGNFVIDRDTGRYWAFVMRTEDLGTRYFAFDLPPVSAGEMDPVWGVKRVVLSSTDVIEAFDCAYHRYIQGAISHEGRIYSTEGFANDQVNRPAIRVIHAGARCEEVCVDLMALGYNEEPEMIDFYEGDCYYSDAHGNLYVLEFE